MQVVFLQVCKFLVEFAEKHLQRVSKIVHFLCWVFFIVCHTVISSVYVGREIGAVETAGESANSNQGKHRRAKCKGIESLTTTAS